MKKFKQGNLRSGSKKGPKVTKRNQAIAIMLDEKKKAQGGMSEYMPKHDAGPSKKMRKRNAL